MGAKYCIEQGRPQIDIKQSIQRFTHSIRLRYWLLANGDSGDEPPTDTTNPDYIPKLYIPSQWTPPSVEMGTIEMRMLDFATHLERASRRSAEQPPGFNLSREQQHKLMKLLQSDDRFIVCQTDKNLGPEILESDAYIKLTLKDHQSDRSTYQLLSREESATILITTRRRFQHRNSLSSAEKTYFERSMKLGQHNHHH